MAHIRSSFELGAKPIPDAILCSRERRRGVRYPTDEPASFIQIHPAAEGRVPIRVRDVSEKGMRLQTPQYIFPGTIIQVRLSKLIAVVEVRYCRSDGERFSAGVEVLEVLSRTGKREVLV
jgi:hypothetical protein